jgi:ABC-type multidrug transport system permease subunit
MSTTLTAFIALVRKDLVTFLRDRRALVVSVLTPIVIAAFFGFLFGGNGGDAAVSRIEVGTVDQDGSELSKAIVADLASDASLTTLPMSEAQARQRVRTGKLRAAIVFPLGFGAAAPRALFGGAAKPAVQLLYDPSQSMVRPIIEGLLTQHVMQRMTRALFSASGSTDLLDSALANVRESAALTDASRANLMTLLEAVRLYQTRSTGMSGTQAGGGLSVPFALANVAVSTGPHYNSYAHSFAGMSVQFILFMGIDAGVGLLLMRQQGVWRRLRAAPLSRGVLLGSRVVGTTLIAVLILAIVYLVAALVFKVRIAGSVVGFAGVAVAFALLAATTGLMIAAAGRSVAATRGLSMFAVLILVMLGGAWVPAFVFPEWLQRVSLLVPTRWAVDGLDAMTWRGLPFAAALEPVAVMLGWAALFALVAVWRFDWEAD